MKVYFSLFGLDSILTIVILASAGAVLLIVLFLLLNIFVFSRRRNKKKVGDLINKYEYLHSAFIGRDSTNLSRIEFISRYNLIYVDTYQNCFKSYHEILDNDDSEMSHTISKLKTALEDRRYKDLKVNLPLAREQLASYEKKVNQFGDDIIAILKPEEEAKGKIAEIKNEVRSIKADVEAKQSEFVLCIESFQTVFTNIDKQFSKFDDLVSHADYEGAANLLPGLQQVITFLKQAITALPDLCAQLQTILPDKISALKDRYESMTHSGYPLYRILGDEDISDLEKEMNGLIEKTKAFQLPGIQEEIDVMLSRIEDYNIAFEKEVEAKSLYEKNSQEAYDLETKAERKLIRLNNDLPEIRKFYMLGDEDQAALDAISQQINQAGAIRRKLDSLTSSLSHQPYSSFVEKMEQLKEESQKSLELIDDFSNHLLALKKECASWLENLKIVYQKAKDAERKLREISIKEISEKYKPSFESLYHRIDDSYRCLQNAPINVVSVKKNVDEILNQEALFLEEINSLHEKMKLADASFLMANRLRPDYAQLASLLSQAETLYYQGEFEAAYQMVSSELAKRRAEQ